MLSQKKNKLLPPYPPHLKNVTTLPWKCKTFTYAGNVAFLQMFGDSEKSRLWFGIDMALKMTDQRDKKN